MPRKVPTLYGALPLEEETQRQRVLRFSVPWIRARLQVRSDLENQKFRNVSVVRNLWTVGGRDEAEGQISCGTGSDDLRPRNSFHY